MKVLTTSGSTLASSIFTTSFIPGEKDVAPWLDCDDRSLDADPSGAITSNAEAWNVNAVTSAAQINVRPDRL
jgi:hypothetical protein